MPRVNENSNTGKACKSIAGLACLVLVVAACVGAHFAMSGPESTADPIDASTLAKLQEEEELVKEYADEVSSSEAEGGSEVRASALPDYVAGEVLIGLEAGETASDLVAKLDGLDYVVGHDITESEVGRGWAVVKLQEGLDVEEALERLAADGVTERAQPNFLYSLDSDIVTEASDSQAADAMETTRESSEGSNPVAAADVPDGLFSGEPESLESEGEVQAQASSSYINDAKRASQYGLISIQADRAYSYAKGKTSGTRPSVAILDSGAYVQHPDLKANVVDYYDAVNKVTKSQFESTGRPFYDVDVEGSHGTHVSGIVSAVTNNSRGVAGSSANAGIVPVKVGKLYSTSSGYQVGVSTSALITGYRYVYQNHAKDNIKVVNLSVGHNGDKLGVDSEDRELLDWIYLTSSDAGILTVIASGNDGKNGAYRDFPSYYAETGLGVIALDQASSASTVYSSRATYSNYNKSGLFPEQVAAPGTRIYSTKAWASKNASSMSEQYGFLTGTSQAAPLVAGTAALAWWIKPALTPDEMKSLLMSNTTSINPTLAIGMGKIDAYNVVYDAKQNGGSYLKGKTSLGVGSSVQLTPSRSGSWTYSSFNSAIAQVSSTGKVTGKSAGSTVITAYSSSLDKRIRQVVTVHNPAIKGATTLAAGSSTTLSVSDPVVNNNGTWEWISLDKSVATVDIVSGKVTGVKAGTVRIAAVLLSNTSVVKYHTITVTAPRSVSKVSMYRLYNPNSGEHFYTSSAAEKNNLVRVGWRDEGIGWYAPSSGADVYRLYNPNAGDHHYTTSASERDTLRRVGWSYEGVGWKSGGSVKLYRQYNPNARAGSHNYTTSKAENDTLVRAGWRAEGVGWYGM